MSRIRILIADDHVIFRDVLRRLLEENSGLLVVGEACDGDEALEATHAICPDILLLDCRMPRRSGKDVLRALSTTPNHTRVVLLTADIERDQIPELFAMGAHGLVLKDACPQVLFECIQNVIQGRYWIGDHSFNDAAAALASHAENSSPKAPHHNYGLTPREMQIIQSVLSGCTNREIAAQMAISIQTVKHHMTSIFDKLGVYSRLELTLFAIRNNLDNHNPAVAPARQEPD